MHGPAAGLASRHGRSRRHRGRQTIAGELRLRADPGPAGKLRGATCSMSEPGSTANATGSGTTLWTIFRATTSRWPRASGSPGIAARTELPDSDPGRDRHREDPAGPRHSQLLPPLNASRSSRSIRPPSATPCSTASSSATRKAPSPARSAGSKANSSWRIGGTLFLDEIADMSPAAQAKILRAVEYGEFERLGSEQLLEADVRLISATHLPLARYLETDHFRKDLFYRISGITLQAAVVAPASQRPPHHHGRGDRDGERRRSASRSSG